jgi:glycosyltransferase involved in cell wall biosynthesis
MNIKDKLQIILITYNREKNLENTLSRLFCENSPIREFDITVLDNNSMDKTAEIVEQYKNKYPNLKYIKNKYNLGIGGNIFRAIELADREYHWVIADDDIYFWENWHYLEDAILKGFDIICAARYAIPNNTEIHCPPPPISLFQLTFIPALIFKTSLLNDNIMLNIINNIYTLFPHIPIAISVINNDGSLCILEKPIVANNMQPTTDASYTRGYTNEALYKKISAMSWIVGYANIISHLKTKALRYGTMKYAINCGMLYKKRYNFYNHMYVHDWLPVFEVMEQMPVIKRFFLILYYIISRYIIRFYRLDSGIFVCLFGKFKTKLMPCKLKKQ